MAYARSRVQAGYKTFSYIYYDNVEYDLIFGAKYADDGLTLASGFTGYILEIRLYSNLLLTMAELDG